ncbi:MAG: methyltransferase domain-containing protein [Phaeodactylibacter sp.]|uniref:methyltransferase domain-containing protein n=1 Tax=Phaeodactylibacter sp. TaxID=1940289 RepID=UPI0032ED4689
MPSLDARYWESRYHDHNTPWDIGYPSPPLVHYLEQHTTVEDRILIPGAGHAYEAVWLHQQGYQQVFVCDWAPSAFEILAEKAPDFPKSQQLVQNFFTLDLQVDLILEQTFFCAIDPGLRDDYARQAHQLLRPGGKLAGVLFTHPLQRGGPPFGGAPGDYRAVFEPYFEILKLAPAADSIKPRAGSEVFIELKKR